MFTWTLGLFCLLGLFLELGSSQTICPTGKYGVDCELNCNSNCLKNCHRVTGTCEEACVIGRYDSYCDKTCNCTFGCDKETGFCPCDLHGCSTCNTGGTGCSSCDVTSYFVPSSNDGSKCCSRGCNTDGVGILDCDTNGVCALDDCIDGYWGDRCTICRELITNCEICESKQNTNDLICQQCLPGYNPSMDQSRCCPPGCDDCRGDICSVCKPGYYIYNEICDTCGDFCQPPGNGTARCNPVTGECHYGCLDGWHGLKCDVQCTLPDCEICDFKESDRLLTCKTCVEGWAPNEFTGLCQTCNVNCVNSRCDSTTGYCTEGCMPGWRSDRCDQTCEDADMGNCTICGRDSFTCSECMFDFWGATCEYICSQNCVPVVNGHVCDKDDAACMSGCMPGYWREDCNRECPNCLNDVCQIADGVCQDQACKPGYWGPDCMRPCSTNCANNPATGDFECQFDSGICTHGCKYNQYGVLCDMTCSSHCLDNRTTTVSPFGEEPLCSQLDGDCKYGCEDYYYKSNCSETCSSTCVTQQCDRDAGYCLACNEVPKGWLCYDGSCPVGKYGDYCNTTCPGEDRCLDNLCDRNTAACEGCINNFWGENCQNNCSTCVDGLCNQETGICAIGCIDGYFGTQCRDKCSVRCDVCSRADGSCLICSNGTWGPVCENKCSANCTLIDGDLLLCDKATGACSSGECVSGSFGLSCDRECYEHCYAVEEVATCEYETGYCSDGCEIGWYGSLCTGECSLKCRNKNCFDDSNICLDGCADDYYGDRCLYLCNSGCNLGICDDLGYCKAGCIKNRFGDMCSETCNTTCTDDMCDRQSGHCAECSKQDPDILCRTALCDPGRYGLLCNISCPSPACLDNRCNRDGGDCDGCITGRYGQLCEEQCNTCNNGYCTQPTGICLEGCIAGWYGDRCENTCDSCVTCRQNSGICTECSAGTYGISCENNCSANCQPAKDDIKSCNVYTGACDSFACLPGYYGADCVMPCHTNCGPDDSGQVMCDFINGACLADCTKGFFGVHCERACDSRCHDQTCDRGRGICADCELVPRPPNCPDANCTVTMYGQYCNLTCPVGCERACQRYTSACANCKPGFYLPQCNQTCDYPGCYRCAQKTGKCESCKPGKYGINCDKNCGDCQPIDGEVICDMMTGDCLSDVCQAGRWGLDCTLVCNPNCADENGRDICHKFTGVCELGCDISHFGDFCEGNCSSRCKNSNCKDSVNNCQEGCERGYYGLNSCQTPCSGTCINKNCRETDGFCTEGCIDGFYKERCSKACNSTCINDKCDRVTGHCPECSQTTENPYYFCRAAECNATFQGTLCDQPCPENCAEECERYTGKCKGCDPYFWFDNCTRTCTNCLQGLCDQATGICSQGCNPGYFDPFCSTPCVFTGCETCSRQTGLCITCKDEFYGDACEKSCSPQCTPTKDGLHLCDKASGTCQTGSCLSGSWDLDCYQTCNINCKTDSFGDRTCYYQSGNCSNGCEDKFWDDHCDKPCSHTCLYDLCKRDATCLLGCVDETYGAACEWPCEETCNDNTCDRVTGYCAECNKTLEEQSELCRTAACPVEGTSGLYCNMTCPENCESGCDRNNRKCDFCKASLWGDNCTDTCGNCADSRCFQNNGTCTDACEVGFWGNMCLDLCKHDGCLACERMDGECSICLPNLWGFSCNITCSPACPPSDDDNEIYCNKLTGDCDVGTCALGFYGTDCTKECSPYCVSKVCDFEKGICSIGCLKGWKNNFCNQTCSQTCAQNECSRDGRCDIGCVEGYSGFDCTTPCGSTCINNKCDREQGVCLECLKEPVNEQDFTCRTAGTRKCHGWWLRRVFMSRYTSACPVLQNAISKNIESDESFQPILFLKPAGVCTGLTFRKTVPPLFSVVRICHVLYMFPKSSSVGALIVFS